MKKALTRFLVIYLVVAIFFSSVTLAECVHEWEFQYDPVSVYEVVDKTYHKIVATDLYYICSECGDTKYERQATSEQHQSKHYFNSKNVCASCGYNWEFEYDPVNNYQVVDDTYHKIVSTTLYYICSGCGETEVETEKASEQHQSKHNFNSKNVCNTCGYEKVIVITPTPTPIPTPTATPTTTPKATETAIPTVVITATLTPTVKPTATVAPTQVVTAAPTVAVTPTATIAPTVTPSIIITAAPTVHICTYKESHWYGIYNYFDEETHTRHHVVTPTCTSCGKTLEKTNTLEYVPHKFENGKCTKCGAVEISVSIEDKEYATEKINELEVILELVITAMKNGDVLDSDANNAISNINSKIIKYKEIQNGSRKLSTIQESEKLDIESTLKAEELILKTDWARKVPASQAIAYYQIVNGLEVTGWINEETYNFAIETAMLNTAISNYLKDANKLSAEELVDLIGSGIQIIQENKDNEFICNKTYAEIEVLIKYLKLTPEYMGNRNLDEVDWIFKVGDNTPGFKDIVDLTFTKENIFSDNVGTLPKDYLDQYNIQYVANTLTLIDGVIIIGLGGSIVSEYATTGTVVLTVGGQTLAQAYDQLVAYGQKVGNLSKQTIDHIFKGVTKSNGKVSGAHFEKYLDSSMKVVKTSPPNSFDVYTGDVYVNGVFSKPNSTFFPSNWTDKQVIDAIIEASQNIDKVINSTTYIGITNTGMKIEIYLNKLGEITSAFPIYE